MSDIQPFSFEGFGVRTIAEDEAGLFVATDIAKLLGYGSAKDMARNLDSDEKGMRQVPTPGGVQNMTVITEARSLPCDSQPRARIPRRRAEGIRQAIPTLGDS